MKKAAVISIVIASTLLVAGGVILAIGIANRQTPQKISKTHIFEENFSNFNCKLSVADLEFKVSEDGSKKVICEETEKLYHEVKVENETLVINAIDSRKWHEKIFSDNPFSNLKVTVYLSLTTYSNCIVDSATGDVTIPQDFSFTDLTVKVDTGDVKINAPVSGAAKINSSTGDIRYENSNPASLSIGASTGNINVTNVHVSGDASISASTGKIGLNSLTAENLNVRSSTGKITLTNTVITKHIEAKASTGDVIFNDSDAETLNVKTSTGDVKGTLLTSKIFYTKTHTGKVNVPQSTTGGMCQIETDTGDINIQIKA